MCVFPIDSICVCSWNENGNHCLPNKHGCTAQGRAVAICCHQAVSSFHLFLLPSLDHLLLWSSYLIKTTAAARAPCAIRDCQLHGLTLIKLYSVFSDKRARGAICSLWMKLSAWKELRRLYLQQWRSLLVVVAEFWLSQNVHLPAH